MSATWPTCCRADDTVSGASTTAGAPGGRAASSSAMTPLRTGQLLAARIVAGVFGYALVFHMIGAPFPRYGIPFRPLLYPMAILTGMALWSLRTSAPGRKRSALPRPGLGN